MKKICLIIIFMLFMPITVGALEPNYKIDGFYVQANIDENGDMHVKEQIVMNGAFNGYIRDLFYKGEYELYDASYLQLLRVCEVSMINVGRFNFTENDLTCFTSGNGNPGDSHVYERVDYYDSISLKMYNYNKSGIKIFYIEYILNDVVVVHNDVAELYWTFIGRNFDDNIKDVRITIDLPSVSSDLRVWAHGPLNGNINRVDNKRVIATISNLYANTLVDVRATFDKEIIPYSNKISSKDALETILAEEEKRADEANRQREIAKVIHNGAVGINLLWLVGAIVLALYAYRRYDKEHKATFNLEYHREFPAEYGPEVVEYLINKNITPLSLSAAILNIVRKKGFEVREEVLKRGKKNYILIKGKTDSVDKLTAEEAYIVDWLIKDYGNGAEVSLKDITDASDKLSTAKEFIKKYDKWHTLARMNAIREDFFEDNLGFKIKGSLYAFLGIFIFIVSMSLFIESALLFFTPLVSIMLFIYIVIFKKRTIKGNDHYVKWKAFKKFLLDFGRFNEKELPEVVLWEKYLVYAVVFGIADKVSKVMEVKLKNMDMNTNMPIYSHMYMHHYFASNLVSTINTTRSMSASKIAQTSSSSGSGYGGGFSGGGGFGGGGGGGGGRGF